MRVFTIYGQPVAKGRPRLGKWGTYTPEKTVNYENLVKLSYIEQYKGFELMEGYLKIEMYFFMQIPKSTSNKKRELMLQRKILPDKKPDYDNMAKAITDALNGVAYIDDNQVVEAHIYKFYAEEPRAEVFITKI